MSGWTTLRKAAQAPAAALRAAEGAVRSQQESWLLRLLQRNADSRYGRRHDFASIRSIADFQRSVPIARHPDLAGDIADIAAGADNVLTAEPVIAFEQTSGSTTGSKLVPYTKAGLGAFEASALAWLDRLMHTHPAIIEGTAYWSISPAGRPSRETAGGIPIGFASDAGYFSPTIGAALAAVSAVPFSVGVLTDHPTWQARTLRALLARADLSFVSVWNPTFWTLLLDAMPAYADPRRLWPQLACISAWGDGAAAPAFRALGERMPGVLCQRKGLMATEGFVTIALPGRAHAVPALTATFLELVDDSGDAHGVAALEVGAEYRVVITTESGLYRYDLGDRVACRNRDRNGLPELAFLGRADLTSDLVGEKLGEVFVARCLAACGIDGMLALEQARYALVVDAQATAPDIETLERRLGENPHYRHARRIGQLGAIVLRRCPDLDATYLAFRMAQGQKLGDIKAPALIARPEDSARFLAAISSDAALRRIA